MTKLGRKKTWNQVTKYLCKLLFCANLHTCMLWPFLAQKSGLIKERWILVKERLGKSICEETRNNSAFFAIFIIFFHSQRDQVIKIFEKYPTNTILRMDFNLFDVIKRMFYSIGLSKDPYFLVTILLRFGGINRILAVFIECQ